MADAVTSVGAIRAGDTITYTDHFGGDSEGPVSTAILLLHKGTQVKTFTLDFRLHRTQCMPLSAAEVSFWCSYA